MPIKRDSIQGILQAFATGMQIAQQREDEKIRRQEKQEAIKREDERYKEEQTRLKEQDKLQKERLKIEDTRFTERQNVEKSLRALEVADQLAKSYSERGSLPPSYTESGRFGSIPISEGVATTKGRFESSDPNLPSFEALNPEDAIRQQTEFTRIANEPKQQAALELKELEQRFKAEEAEKEYLRDLQRTRENNQLRLDLAKLNNASREEIATLRNELSFNKPLSRDELIDYAPIDDKGNRQPLPVGTTLKDVIGNLPTKITPQQETKLVLYNELEDKFIDIKNKLEQVGYENYYKGGSYAGIEAEGRKLLRQPRTQDVTDLEQAIGDLKSLIASDRFGLTIPKGETDLIKTFIPEASQLEDAGTMKSRIEGGLKDVRNKRGLTLGVKGTQRNRVRIRVDEQGNEIQ